MPWAIRRTGWFACCTVRLMRVDVVTKEYPPEIYGGAGVHVAELVRALRDRDDLETHVHADHVTASGLLRERLEVGDELLDDGGVVGIGQGLALGRLDHDVDVGLVEGAGGAGEELGLQVGGLLGGDAGDGEVVRHRLGEGGGEADDHGQHDHPRGDEERPASVGGGPESG